ncbi:hypothetical protein EJ06DRAFT_372499 [Trichodelitschia bisporula]|uniref:Uncharacterized protein n=1 Tax=Trichodelitschia bisporula TaxID=703511 RepID=A0A6G1I1B1_9PEZI|nr:hypothetical protein EJ06DRAFT_372499 [Trichodelitschia bisporula]
MPRAANHQLHNLVYTSHSQPPLFAASGPPHTTLTATSVFAPTSPRTQFAPRPSSSNTLRSATHLHLSRTSFTPARTTAPAPARLAVPHANSWQPRYAQ